MVLDQKDARKTELLGLDDVIDEVVIGGAVARRAAASARPAEKPEFHASTSFGIAAPNIWRDPSRVDDGAGIQHQSPQCDGMADMVAGVCTGEAAYLIGAVQTS
jgi:hypothetical protein